jgi:hypothetical protein
VKLIEFEPGPYRNLPGLPLYFTLDPESAASSAAQGCSIRFLVGRNGTGKTNILRFLTSIFLALEEDFRRPQPASPAYNIPFRLRYQLRDDTILIESRGQGRSGVRFTFNQKEPRPDGDLPDRDRILPTMLLVYTTGDISGWQTLFQPPTTPEEAELESQPLPDTVNYADEQPPDWQPTSAESTDQPAPPTTVENPDDSGETATSSVQRVHLVEPTHLRLAVLAALLDQQAQVAQGKAPDDPFAEVLGEAVNVRLVSFSLLVDLQNARLLPAQRTALSHLFDLATLTLEQWGAQLWVYDLAQVRMATGHSTLIDLAEQVSGNRFQFFQLLVGLQRAGILRTVNLVLRPTLRRARCARCWPIT